MPRSRSFDEETALDAIRDVFWRRGFEAASYGELMQASGLGKGSLYAAWGDKAALYRTVLTRYADAELALLAAVLAAPGRSAMARLEALLDYPIDAARRDRRGCLLCNASVDRALDDPETQAIVDAAFAKATAAIDRVAAEASGHAVGSGAHLFAVFLGLRVMARAGAAAATMRTVRDAALASLKKTSRPIGTAPVGD